MTQTWLDQARRRAVKPLALRAPCWGMARRVTSDHLDCLRGRRRTSRSVAVGRRAGKPKSTHQQVTNGAQVDQVGLVERESEWTTRAIASTHVGNIGPGHEQL